MIFTGTIKNKMFIIFSLLVPVTVVSNNPEETTRSKPKCKACKQPMKGHKNVKDCPKNQNKWLEK